MAVRRATKRAVKEGGRRRKGAPPHLPFMSLQKPRDGAVVRSLHSRKPHERKLLPTSRSDLAGRTYSLAVSIKEHGQKHRGIVKRPSFSAVLAAKLSNVHLIHTFPDQPRRVIFPDPAVGYRRQCQNLISISPHESTIYDSFI